MSLSAEEIQTIRATQAQNRRMWADMEEYTEMISAFATEVHNKEIKAEDIDHIILDLVFSCVAAELNLRRGLRMLGEEAGLN